MYALRPSKVYVLDRVYDDPRCVERLERVLGALGNTPEVRRFGDDELPAVMDELHGLWPPAALDDPEPTYCRPLVFTTFELRHRRPDLKPLLEHCPPSTSLRELEMVYGHMTTAIDQHPHQRDRADNVVCWPTMNLGTITGCSHGCVYCGFGRGGRFLSIALNLEDYMEQLVGPVIEMYPWNKVFRMILDVADLITFEPEYGLFDLFTRKLAQYEGRYGHFHTISSNVDWMADLPHRDRLVGVWSTTCEAVARDIEPGSGQAVDRYLAAARCQAMGIPVRYKYKPVIPVVNWREEYAESIRQALTLTRPESIGFALYMWNSYESMAHTLPLDLLDPWAVDAARDAQDVMRGRKAGPFPHEVRKAIYQHLIRECRRWDSEVKLYVCTETREMWDELTDELGQDPRWYHCGCGSIALPNRVLGVSEGLRHSTYHPTPV